MAPRYPTPRADEFLERLRERVPDKTLRHILGVTDLMVDVAEAAGITEEQAVLAGLLHDYCKATKGKELLTETDNRKIDVPASWSELPKLLHGPVAAEIARTELGVTDEDVLDAVYWHTTGRPEWNPVGLALYFSDFSEPNRTHDEANVARTMLESEGFEAALRYVVDAKLRHVESSETADPTTAAFANWIRDAWRP